MIQVKEQKKFYETLFDHYPVFDLFITYAFNHRDYDLYVDNLANPKTLILYVSPAFILLGEHLDSEKDSIKTLMGPGAWIISPNASWDHFLTKLYDEHLKTFPRIRFDDSKLSIEHLKSLRKPLPPELKIVPIEQKHLEEGMIKDQIINHFYQNIDFLEHGFGLALVNDKDVIHGFALTNYPIDDPKNIEVSYRVGYDDFPYYRQKGIGTTLVSCFIEECLNRGYHPVWDAANDVSAHIARKLGYQDVLKWNMYHITS